MRKAIIILGLLFVFLPQIAGAAYTSGTIINPVHTVFISHVTGSGALELQVEQSTSIQLLAVRVHVTSAGTTQTLTTFIDSGLSANHDVVLDTQSMVSVTDHVFRPTGECIIDRGDVLKVGWTNAGSKTWGASIVWRKLN